MPLIGPEDREAIRREFEGQLVADVELTLIGPSALSPPTPDLTPQIRELLQELVALSPRLSLVQVDLPTPEQRVALALEPDEGGPITVVSGAGKGKVRFVGAPAGHEFPNLVRAIVEASRGRSDLSPASRESLAKIARPVHIRVFFTPT